MPTPPTSWRRSSPSTSSASRRSSAGSMIRRGPTCTPSWAWKRSAQPPSARKRSSASSRSRWRDGVSIHAGGRDRRRHSGGAGAGARRGAGPLHSLRHRRCRPAGVWRLAAPDCRKAAALSLALSPVGLTIAVAFSAALAGTLGWMLRVPPPAPRGATSTLRSVEAIRKVLVPILDLGASVRAVELAARLNQGHKAEMLIVYVHEIPLQAPLVMPEKDPRIQRALAAAAFIATQHAIEPRTRVNVARQAGHRIVEIAREENADLIVMGISHQNRPNESPLGRVAEHVVRNAPCEVVVDRVPRQKVAFIPTEVG